MVCEVVAADRMLSCITKNLLEVKASLFPFTFTYV